MATPAQAIGAAATAHILEIVTSDGFQSSVLSGLILAIATIALRAILPKARVMWAISHQFTFNVKLNDKPATAAIRTVFIQNVGRSTAEDVEIHLNHQPQHFQLWPTFDYKTSITPAGNFIISIPTLGKGERLTIEALQVALDMPNVLRVRTKDGECRQVQMAPYQVLPAWVRIALWVLILIGLFSILRLVIAAFL